ncbi:MAG TPA: hypothetical protein VF885_16475 [Arthrobacter sp.]
MTFNENDHPRGAAGRFTETHHAEAAGVTLQAPAPGRPELDGYDIPAPLESQKFLDGTRIPEGASFEEAYEEFFRPLDEHETAHGAWVNTRPPSEDQLRDLAGLAGVNLGRTTGFFVEAEEATGEPVIAVSTRNGNSQSRDCIADSDFDCMRCKHCIQEHLIPALPTYIRDEEDSDDDSCVTSIFRPLDPAAAKRYLTDQKTREVLNHRTWAREATTSGKQPPWAILTPVRDKSERQQLVNQLPGAKKRAAVWQDTLGYADVVTKALDAGGALPTKPTSQSYPDGGIAYNIHTESLARYSVEAQTHRSAAAALRRELQQDLPPMVAGLASAEHARLEKAAGAADESAARSSAAIEHAIANIRDWADRQHERAAPLTAAVTKLEADIAAFDWSSSWPGDPADCPPRPAD